MGKNWNGTVRKMRKKIKLLPKIQAVRFQEVLREITYTAWSWSGGPFYTFWSRRGDPKVRNYLRGGAGWVSRGEEKIIRVIMFIISSCRGRGGCAWLSPMVKLCPCEFRHTEQYPPWRVGPFWNEDIITKIITKDKLFFLILVTSMVWMGFNF